MSTASMQPCTVVVLSSVGTSGTDTAQPNELLLSCMVDLVGIYTAEPGSSTIPEQVLCWLGSQKVAMGSLLSGTYYADKIFLKGNFHADHITFERHTLAAQVSFTPTVTAIPCAEHT